MKGFPIGQGSFEIFGAQIGYMIVTLFIQVQARLRFKSGTDPSVRPSLLKDLIQAIDWILLSINAVIRVSLGLATPETLSDLDLHRNTSHNSKERKSLPGNMKISSSKDRVLGSRLILAES